MGKRERDSKPLSVSYPFGKTNSLLSKTEALTKGPLGLAKSSFTGSGLFVLLSQWGNNNELALQHGGFCTM